MFARLHFAPVLVFIHQEHLQVVNEGIASKGNLPGCSFPLLHVQLFLWVETMKRPWSFLANFGGDDLKKSLFRRQMVSNRSEVDQQTIYCSASLPHGHAFGRSIPPTLWRLGSVYKERLLLIFSKFTKSIAAYLQSRGICSIFFLDASPPSFL